ncbi:hypothetical protein EVU96_09265 [Bacillus infantis]|uniref:hypothetical protein n=1 Tax=Bacillus infantis TaxID=324767 RepID=UPI00101CC8E5|nr:hypothetical protein [Bacillus infantis]RYI30594.1 hypothetical protein EVU96_09265 [Bacillus infantis]
MIIFDEKKYAELMLKKGFQTKNKNVYELNILAKYLHAKYESDVKVKNELVVFCEKYLEHFNKDEWYKIVNKTLTSAKRKNIVTDKEVLIMKEELDIITEIEDIREQQVAFVLLVLYKFYDYKKFEVIIEDLYRLAKLNLNSKTKLKLLQSLTSKDLIDITMGGKRWVKFAVKIGEAVISIKDFDDFVYEYLRYIEMDGYTGCEKCNKAIKLTSNRKKHCKNCQQSLRRDYKTIKQREYRS